jgi:hypothetical protein
MQESDQSLLLVAKKLKSVLQQYGKRSTYSFLLNLVARSVEADCRTWEKLPVSAQTPVFTTEYVAELAWKLCKTIRIHYGVILDDEDLGKIIPSVDGRRFSPFSRFRYGPQTFSASDYQLAESVVQLDVPDSSLRVTDSHPGYGTTPEEKFGHVQTFTLPESVDSSELDDLLESDAVTELVDRIHAGYDDEFVHGNWVAVFSEDATEALELLQVEFDNCSTITQEFQVDAYEALGSIDAEHLGITAETDDDTLWGLANEQTQEAAIKGGIIVDRDEILEIFCGWRDDLIAKLEDEE